MIWQNAGMVQGQKKSRKINFQPFLQEFGSQISWTMPFCSFFVFIVPVYFVPKTWRPILVVIGMLQIQRLVAVTGFQ